MVSKQPGCRGDQGGCPSGLGDPEAVRCMSLMGLRRTQYEQISSGLPLKADITQYSRHVSKVPSPDIGSRFI